MDSQGKVCVHHWIIDMSNCGICKKCGEKKQFNNSWSYVSLQNTWSKTSKKAQHITSIVTP